MLNTRDMRRLEINSTFIGAPIMLFSWLIGRITDAIDGVLFWTWAISIALVFGAITHAIYRQTSLYRRRRLYHAPGWATADDFRKVFGRHALLKLAKYIRPSLVIDGWLNPQHLRRRKATDYGMRLGKAVSGGLSVRLFRRVYASYERCLLVFATMGAGKTSLIIHHVIDAPGAIVAASTKPDLYEHTAELREQLGPVYVFNPQNIGGIPNNFHWDPLTGCENYQHATDRATALVMGAPGIAQMDETIWREKCIQILSKYLMAARLLEADMHKVAQWVDNPNDEEAVRALENFYEAGAPVPPGWPGSLQAEIRNTAERMKGSMWSLMRGAVGFIANPEIAEVCRGGADTGFDAPRFAHSRGTLYLLGDDKDETIAPLLNALTSYIYGGVKAEGAARRLDPPFGFILDEAAKITPVPLGRWAADGRGHGIYIVAVVQSLAQLRDRWGEQGANEIEGIYSKVILSGIQNVDDLEDISKLIGHRPGETDIADLTDLSITDHHGLMPREVPIMPPPQIRMIPRGFLLVIIGEGQAVMTKYGKGQARAARMRKKLIHQEKAGLASAVRPLGNGYPLDLATSDDTETVGVG